MPLSRAERKDRLKHGDLTDIARAMGVSRALVSFVMRGGKNHSAKAREIQVRIARKLRLPVDEVFPERAPDPTPESAAPADEPEAAVESAA